MDIPAAILQAVDAVYDKALAFITALAAVGALTMAALQTIKDMLPVRRWFEATWVRAWLDRQAREAPAIPGSAVRPYGKTVRSSRRVLGL